MTMKEARQGWRLSIDTRLYNIRYIPDLLDKLAISCYSKIYA